MFMLAGFPSQHRLLSSLGSGMQYGRELVCLGDRPSLHGLPQDRLRGTKFLSVALCSSSVELDGSLYVPLLLYMYVPGYKSDYRN